MDVGVDLRLYLPDGAGASPWKYMIPADNDLQPTSIRHNAR